MDDIILIIGIVAGGGILFEFRHWVEAKIRAKRFNRLCEISDQRILEASEAGWSWSITRCAFSHPDHAVDKEWHEIVDNLYRDKTSGKVYVKDT